MSTINFTVGSRIETAWLNDVDALVWDIFGGATTVAAAKAVLGLDSLVIGTDVQAWNTKLDDIVALTPTDGNILVGNGTTWVSESGATLRTSLGLGTSDTPDFTGITLGGVGSTLSNYAEGTFTPTIQDDTRSDSESQTYAVQLGRFTRIGNMYFLSGTITLSSLGTLTGSEQAVIANIPVAAKTAAGESWSFTVGYSNGLAVTAGNYITGILDSAEQVIKLYKHSDTTGATALTLTELSADGHIEFSGIHHV